MTFCMYVCRPWESLNTPSTSISAEVTIPGYCMTWAALWVLATVILFPFVDVSYRLLVERPGKKLGLGDDGVPNCLTSSHSGMPGCLTSRTVNITGRFPTKTLHYLFPTHTLHHCLDCSRHKGQGVGSILTLIMIHCMFMCLRRSSS
jgi:hypothetical protein